MASTLGTEGTGRIHFDVSGNQIDTTGKDSHGVYAWQPNTAAAADVTIVANSNQVTTEGESAHGIRGTVQGSGDVKLDTSDNTITTEGKNAYGIYGYHVGDGDIVLTSQHDTITTEDSSSSAVAFGILAWHELGNGNIDIDVVGGATETRGDDSHAIVGLHGNRNLDPVTTQGQVDIEVKDTVITTQGEYGYGILGAHGGSGRPQDRNERLSVHHHDRSE